MPIPKIVLITLEYPPERGGVSRYLGSLVMESRGAIEVIVESHQAMAGPGCVRHAVLFRNAWPRWWPLVHICRQQSTDNRVQTTDDGSIVLSALSKDRRQTILLISHILPVGTAALISRMLGGPEYAVLFHGLDLRLIQSMWKRWLVRCIARRAKALIVNSLATERELRRIIPEARPNMLTPGVRRPWTEIFPKPKTVPRVISIARLVSRKGLDVAIQAVGSIQKETQIEYVIIGDGSDLKRLEDVASAANTRVRWISRPSDEEKWSWLASSDVFLLPVRDEGNDVEGFGIVFLEAASVGVPSIAGRSGGAIEAVVDGETGMVVDPLNVGDITSALRKLLCDENLRCRMGEKAQQRVERDFQWSDRWAKLQQMLAGSGCQAQFDNEKHRVAVVIPCFNHANSLRRTLQKLTCQTLKPTEVVIVDDGSTDDPASVAMEFSARSSLPIRFVRFDINLGAPTARNHGFRMTSAPFVLFLDADAELVPQALETMRRELQAQPEADFCYANFWWGLKSIRSRAFDPDALQERNFIHTSSLIRRVAFLGFDETLKKFQDWDLWLTMAERGRHGVWIDDYLYRIEPRRDGYSLWLPRIVYALPWPLFGWMPQAIRKYRTAEDIIRKKHHLSS